MLNLNSILVFSDNAKELGKFYRKVLQRDPKWNGGDFSGFKVGGGWLMVGPHDKVKGKSKNPERIMFNFETDDVEGEFKRLKKAGVKVIQEPYEPREAGGMVIATLADPDGNYFQLASP